MTSASPVAASQRISRRARRSALLVVLSLLLVGCGERLDAISTSPTRASTGAADDSPKPVTSSPSTPEPARGRDAAAAIWSVTEYLALSEIEARRLVSILKSTPDVSRARLELNVVPPRGAYSPARLLVVGSLSDCGLEFVFVPGAQSEAGEVVTNPMFVSIAECANGFLHHADGESYKSWTLQPWHPAWVEVEVARSWCAQHRCDLPTLQEWEHFGRAGSTTRYFFGDEWDSRYGFVREEWRNGGDEPCRIAFFIPNRLGLHDVHGNLAEWCFDLAPGTNALSLAGGDWLKPPEYSQFGRSMKDSFGGFRPIVRIEVP